MRDGDKEKKEFKNLNKINLVWVWAVCMSVCVRCVCFTWML